MARARATGARARKLAHVMRVPTYRRALMHGVMASVEHEHTPLPREPRTVIDVGANRGQFALLCARRWPEAHLVCVEPLHKPRATLARALRHHDRLEVRDLALADRSGVSTMHVSRADDSSSLLPITATQVAVFPGTEEARRVDVRTARLDEAIAPGSLERPVLLKLDVQGSELAVLRGATGLLGEIDSVLVECSFATLYAGQALADDVLRFLHGQGFRLTNIVNPTTDEHGNVIQADFLFTRSEAT